MLNYLKECKEAEAVRTFTGQFRVSVKSGQSLRCLSGTVSFFEGLMDLRQDRE